jgi:hypothetical protein
LTSMIGTHLSVNLLTMEGRSDNCSFEPSWYNDQHDGLYCPIGFIHGLNSVYTKQCSCIFYHMKLDTEHQFTHQRSVCSKSNYVDKCLQCNQGEAYVTVRYYWTSWDTYSSLCEDCYFKYCDLCDYPECTNKGWTNSWASADCVCNNPPANVCQVHRYREFNKGRTTEHLMWESLQRKLAKKRRPMITLIGVIAQLRALKLKRK